MWNQRIASLRAALLRSAFARNWSLLVVSGILCQILGVLATFRFARILAPGGYGQYNLVLATGSIGGVFASLGLRNVITRRCARNPEETVSLFVVASGLRAISLLITAFAIVVYEQAFGGTLSPSLTLATLVLLVGLNVWDTIESVAFGHELMQYSAAINLAGNILWLVGVWVVPAVWITPLTVSVAFAALQLGEVMPYIIVAARRGWIRRSQFDLAAGRRSARALIGDGMPFWWLQLLTSASFQLPVLMLAIRSDVFQVGLYNAGGRLVGPLNLLMSTALASLYPGLSRLGQVNRGRLAIVVSQALMMVAALGSVGALGISLLRKELIGVLFSEKFAGAADVVAIQCWSAVLQATFAVIGTTLAAIDRQRLLAGLSTCYVVLSLPILWIGVGRGASGLSIAMLISGFVSATYHWVFLMRALQAPLSRSAIPTAVLLLATGIAISWLVPPSVPFAIRIGLVGLMGTGLLTGALSWNLGRARATPQPAEVLR